MFRTLEFNANALTQDAAVMDTGAAPPRMFLSSKQSSVLRRDGKELSWHPFIKQKNLWKESWVRACADEGRGVSRQTVRGCSGGAEVRFIKTLSAFSWRFLLLLWSQNLGDAVMESGGCRQWAEIKSALLDLVSEMVCSDESLVVTFAADYNPNVATANLLHWTSSVKTNVCVQTSQSTPTQ